MLFVQCTFALDSSIEPNTGTNTNWHLLLVLCTDVLAHYRGTYSGAGNSVETFKLAWMYVHVTITCAVR
jgi:hypothetical protein